MRKWVWMMVILYVTPLAAQSTSPASGYCTLGATAASVSGLSSTNRLQGVIPGCTVTVYQHGTQTKSTIYADSSNTPLSNPFTANVAGSPNSGAWIFWAVNLTCYDVVGSGGVAPNTYTAPVTLTEVCLGGGGGGGGGSGNILYVNVLTACGLQGAGPTCTQGNASTTCHDDYAALQACIWTQMGMTNPPADYRFGPLSNFDNANVMFQLPHTCAATDPQTCQDYYFSHYLDLPWNVGLIGTTSLAENGQHVKLTWPSGVPGIYARLYNTLSGLDLNGGDNFDNTNIATYVLPLGFGGTNAASGLTGGAKGYFVSVTAQGWGQHGFNFADSVTLPGMTQDSASADEWEGHSLLAVNNRGWGIFVNGSDGNLGHCTRCEGNFNQLGGIYVGSLYGAQFDASATQGNHNDFTSTATAPGYITSVVCTSGVQSLSMPCTVTTNVAHTLLLGDTVKLTGLSDSNLNSNFNITSIPTSTTFTINYPTNFTCTSGATTFLCYQSETLTPGANTAHAAYYLGTRVWSSSSGGNTTPGSGAWGGCYYIAAQGQFNSPYTESNCPTGVLNGFVNNPQGNAAITTTSNSIAVSSNGPLLSGLSIGRRPTKDTMGFQLAQGGQWLINSNLSTRFPLEFYNEDPLKEVFNPFSILTFARTAYGPSGPNGNGQGGYVNGVSDTNWWCFNKDVQNDNSALLYASLCLPDQTTDIQRNSSDAGLNVSKPAMFPHGLFLSNTLGYNLFGYLGTWNCTNPLPNGTWQNGDTLVCVFGLPANGAWGYQWRGSWVPLFPGAQGLTTTVTVSCGTLTFTNGVLTNKGTCP